MKNFLCRSKSFFNGKRRHNHQRSALSLEDLEGRRLLAYSSAELFVDGGAETLSPALGITYESPPTDYGVLNANAGIFQVNNPIDPQTPLVPVDELDSFNFFNGLSVVPTAGNTAFAGTQGVAGSGWFIAETSIPDAMGLPIAPFPNGGSVDVLSTANNLPGVPNIHAVVDNDGVLATSQFIAHGGNQAIELNTAHGVANAMGCEIYPLVRFRGPFDILRIQLL